MQNLSDHITDLGDLLEETAGNGTEPVSDGFIPRRNPLGFFAD